MDDVEHVRSQAIQAQRATGGPGRFELSTRCGAQGPSESEADVIRRLCKDWPPSLIDRCG